MYLIFYTLFLLLMNLLYLVVTKNTTLYCQITFSNSSSATEVQTFEAGKPRLSLEPARTNSSLPLYSQPAFFV